MRRIIPIIILSQFFCTSMWFAGNAIIPDLIRSQGFGNDFLGHLTSAVQLGFIAGTLVFAALSLSDRFSPSAVFLMSAILGAACNLGTSINTSSEGVFLSARFLTGFFLAGIYPVAMKIATDYYKEGLGLSLGFLLGAHVLGTALPHLIKSFSFTLNWQAVIYATSALSVAGGIILFLFVPDGPHRKGAQKLNLSAFMHGFRNKKLRLAAYGYFGHMWELYTFWAFIPVMLIAWQKSQGSEINIPLLSFIVIASGSMSCIAAGFFSRSFGPRRVARTALIISCACCLASPYFLQNHSLTLLLAFLLVWGMAVIADSPMFSTLVAQNAPENSRGSSLTIVNCIGFSITVISIQLINFLYSQFNNPYLFMLLAAGPLLGIIALFKNEN